MNKEREGCCNFASAFGYVIPLHVWSGRLFKCQAFSYFLEFQLSDSVAKYCLRHAIHVTNNHCLPKRTSFQFGTRLLDGSSNPQRMSMVHISRDPSLHTILSKKLIGRMKSDYGRKSGTQWRRRLPSLQRRESGGGIKRNRHSHQATFVLRQLQSTSAECNIFL